MSVWDEKRSNPITLRPYEYLHSTGRRFGGHGPSDLVDGSCFQRPERRYEHQNVNRDDHNHEFSPRNLFKS